MCAVEQPLLRASKALFLLRLLPLAEWRLRFTAARQKRYPPLGAPAVNRRGWTEPRGAGDSQSPAEKRNRPRAKGPPPATAMIRFSLMTGGTRRRSMDGKPAAAPQ